MAEEKNFCERLAFVQKTLKAPKGNYNSFGKYKYRSAEDILEAVKPLCADNDLILTLSDEIVTVGTRFYVKATATIQGAIYDGSTSCTAFAREPESKKGMDESQVTGTASSYARKYALNGLFLIDDTKDADTDEYQRQTAPQSSPKKEPEQITAEQAKALDGLIKGDLREKQIGWIHQHYNVKSLNELTPEAYTSLVNQFKAHSKGQDA